MDVTTPEDLNAGFLVEDIYQSGPDPVNDEDGHVLTLARLRDGTAHCYAFTDHYQGDLVEVAPDVAVAYAHAMLAFDPAQVNHQQVLVSSDQTPGLEPGYLIVYRAAPEGIAVKDGIGKSAMTMSVEVGRCFARAIIASNPFPANRLN